MIDQTFALKIFVLSFMEMLRGPVENTDTNIFQRLAALKRKYIYIFIYITSFGEKNAVKLICYVTMG